jgi:hypothetical protein
LSIIILTHINLYRDEWVVYRELAQDEMRREMEMEMAELILDGFWK